MVYDQQMTVDHLVGWIDLELRYHTGGRPRLAVSVSGAEGLHWAPALSSRLVHDRQEIDQFQTDCALVTSCSAKTKGNQSKAMIEIANQCRDQRVTHDRF